MDDQCGADSAQSGAIEVTRTETDVAIIGAGISGIGMAAHLGMQCPDLSYQIIERRDQIGGTWDLFRYPGVRSDSDMHTLGFAFEPWIDEKAIADGPAILAYLERIAEERGIAPHIRFQTTVRAADFDSASGRWQIRLATPDGEHLLSARFLYMGAGYYDYDAPYAPEFTGHDSFNGTIVHPQFWPEDLDYRGKQVVIIGSGATAVTLLPAMADDAAHVTMLQRTPTWMGGNPSVDRLANMMRRILPGRLAYKLTRAKNIGMQALLFRRARSRPEKVADFLKKRAATALGPAWNERDFLPPYDPWDQRLCLVPDDDLFVAVREGRASIVTDEIECFDESGIALKSGKHLDADIIVTATGLALSFGGKVAVSVDGVAVDWPQHYFYRGCMFSDVPNLAVSFGYLNASWTLRVDLVADYLCRLFNQMQSWGADIVTPRVPEGVALEEDDIFTFSSGYLQRAKHLVAKSATALPWRLNQDYLADRADFATRPLDDGNLEFRRPKAGTAEQRPIQMPA